MSIKAMNWAMDQETGDPRAQCLLYVIADCANEEGLCWPSADWMAAKSQQSRATVYRRLDALQASGVLVTFPRWIDENGKIWNAAATGRRRTSPEIRLQFGVQIKRQIGAVDDADEGEGLSQPETGVSQPSDTPVSQVRRGSSHCGDNNSNLNLEDSPPTPSGGSVALEDWKEFERDWEEPILRQSIAQSVWAGLKPDERQLARRAARGYVAWRKAQRKPPNVIGAHLFLRERDAWPRYAELAPDGGTMRSAHAVGSVEAKAIAGLHDVAGRGEAFRTIYSRHGVVNWPKPVTPQLLAFAELPPAWVTLDRNGAGAWEEFMRRYFDEGLRRTRFREGARAPWPWPPGPDGKLYPSTAGPPGAAMNDQDAADFR